MQPVEIKKGIYWVGAIDWNIRDFHGYATPKGTTYNAFLVMDEKITLFDTVKKPFTADLLHNISAVVDPAKIDYLVVNHVEMDHSGAIPAVMEACKPEKIFCSAMGKKALLDHYHRPDWPYEVVDSEQTLSLGKRSVQFIETRMLHWPDSMMSYFPEEKLLLSNDAFGQHWATSSRFDDEVDTGELMRDAGTYYANILMLFSPLVRKLIARVQELKLDIDMIAPDHGLIWRSGPASILGAYADWSSTKVKNKATIIYDTMWQATETMAFAVAEGLGMEGVEFRILNLKLSHRSDVMTELLDSKAVILGSPTINNGMMPPMADMLCYMKGLKPVGRIGAAFGSYGWSGEAVKLMTDALEEMKIPLVEPGLRVHFTPTEDDLAKCIELGRKIGQAVKAGA